MRTLPNVVVSLGLLLMCSSAAADNKSIQGTVIGIDGKPLANAGVWAERLDAKAAPVITKTDVKGDYVFRGLPAGSYAVTVTVKSVPKYRGRVMTRNNAWVRVDFDLRTAAKNTIKPNNSADALRANDLNRIQQSLGGNINGMSFPGH